MCLGYHDSVFVFEHLWGFRLHVYSEDTEAGRPKIHQFVIIALRRRGRAHV